MSGRGGRDIGDTMYDAGGEDNPFKIPPDEKIFSFKEEEKERKI